MKKKETSAASGIAGSLSSAYNRMPELPYLDRATSLILIICVLGYLGFTAYVFLAMPPVEIAERMVEGSLEKNSQLMLLPGERYLYALESPGSAQQIAYVVGRAGSCAGVLVTEQSSQESQSLCILKSGMLADEGGKGVNANFGNRSILLFSPWMLAASENFSWGIDTIYSAQGVEMPISTYFRSRGSTVLAGREAYEIEVGDDAGAPPARFYIDAEKRVLLYADLGNVTVKMASAPFALNWTAQD
ncbi:MAG: hypothetical protein WC717_01430 [Candidatus Micrarchaeia archaeon]|jgi:hypothetical protein